MPHDPLDPKATADRSEASPAADGDHESPPADPASLPAVNDSSSGTTTQLESQGDAGGLAAPDTEANTEANTEAEVPDDAPPAGPAADAPPEAPAPAGKKGAFGGTSNQLLRVFKKQQKLRAHQEQEEAQRMAEEAKRLRRHARQKSKFQDELARHGERVEDLAPSLGFDPERPVTEIPDLPEGMREEEFQVIREDLAFVRILYDPAANIHIYEVIEPTLNRTESEIYTFLRETLVRTLDGRRDRGSGLDWEQVLTDAILQAIVDHEILIDDVGTERIRYHLVRDFLGFGPIDVLMQDPMLEDVSCDGPNVPLYLFHRKYESVRSTVTFEDELNLDSFVIRLAQRSGKHISVSDPLLDATLPDGSRLQATLAREVSTRGSSFTIRKFRADPFTPPDLIRYGSMSPEMAAFFWMVMEEGDSLLVAGGTASGKTTTLNAISQFIPPEKKIVSIEDTREINLHHENWIAGVTRSGFGGQIIGGKPAGTIDMYKLLEAALRQRPEYLVVGEVRGPEALTLFQAMATGHAVYSTMHADSVSSAVYRLENPPINVPRMMLQTVDVMLIQRQVRIGSRMTRRVTEVTEFVGFDPDTGELLTNTVFQWNRNKDRHDFLGKSDIMERYMEHRGLDPDGLREEWNRRILVLEWMGARGFDSFEQVTASIADYYANPEVLMARIKEQMAELNLNPPEAPSWGIMPATPNEGDPLNWQIVEDDEEDLDAAGDRREMQAGPAAAASRLLPAEAPGGQVGAVDPQPLPGPGAGRQSGALPASVFGDAFEHPNAPEWAPGAPQREAEQRPAQHQEADALATGGAGGPDAAAPTIIPGPEPSDSLDARGALSDLYDDGDDFFEPEPLAPAAALAQPLPGEHAQTDVLEAPQPALPWLDEPQPIEAAEPASPLLEEAEAEPMEAAEPAPPLMEEAEPEPMEAAEPAPPLMDDLAEPMEAAEPAPPLMDDLAEPMEAAEPALPLLDEPEPMEAAEPALPLLDDLAEPEPIEAEPALPLLEEAEPMEAAEPALPLLDDLIQPGSMDADDLALPMLDEAESEPESMAAAEPALPLLDEAEPTEAAEPALPLLEEAEPGPTEAAEPALPLLDDLLQSERMDAAEPALPLLPEPTEPEPGPTEAAEPALPLLAEPTEPEPALPLMHEPADADADLEGLGEALADLWPEAPDAPQGEWDENEQAAAAATHETYDDLQPLPADFWPETGLDQADASAESLGPQMLPAPMEPEAHAALHLPDLAADAGSADGTMPPTGWEDSAQMPEWFQELPASLPEGAGTNDGNLPDEGSLIEEAEGTPGSVDEEPPHETEARFADTAALLGVGLAESYESLPDPLAGLSDLFSGTESIAPRAPESGMPAPLSENEAPPMEPAEVAAATPASEDTPRDDAPTDAADDLDEPTASNESRSTGGPKTGGAERGRSARRPARPGRGRSRGKAKKKGGGAWR